MNAITRDPRRSGRAGLLALLAIVACAGATAFALLSRGGSQGQGTDTQAARAEDGTAVSGELEAPATDPARIEGLAPVANFSVTEVGEYARVERSYDGTGTILAEVQMADGSLPPQWTLHIEPSLAARVQGQGRPETRVIEGEPGQGSHEARDLPMGAYRVWAQAKGHRSWAQEVSLFKIAGDPMNPGMSKVNINLRLRPMASVTGQVLTAEGIAADGLAVFLMPTVKGTLPRLEAETDSSGRYRFDAVHPGPWKLHVGQPVRPPVSPVTFRVESTPIDLDPVELPVLASVELLVVDEYARPYPDVEITGYLRGGGVGRLSGKTDGMGRFRTRYLMPGPWRIEAKATDEPMGGKYDYDVKAASDVQQLEMVIN